MNIDHAGKLLIRPIPRACNWHRCLAWAPLTFTDENPTAPANPVVPARRSPAAQARASYQHDAAGRPYRSFRGLIEHLATLTRNQVRFPGTRTDIPVLAEPTSTQRQAFSLIGAPIPLTALVEAAEPSACPAGVSGLALPCGQGPDEFSPRQLSTSESQPSRARSARRTPSAGTGS